MKPETPCDEARSATMRAVRSSGTGPEWRVRRALRGLGVGYRLGGLNLPGKPDLAMPGRKMAVFVHGCFWHGHTCPRGARAPKTNAAYWRAKIDRNRARDAETLAALQALQWRTLVIWECETRDLPALRDRLCTALALISAIAPEKAGQNSSHNQHDHHEGAKRDGPVLPMQRIKRV